MEITVLVDGQPVKLIGSIETITRKVSQIKSECRTFEPTTQAPRETVGPRGFGSTSAHLKR